MYEMCKLGPIGCQDVSGDGSNLPPRRPKVPYASLSLIRLIPIPSCPSKLQCYFRLPLKSTGTSSGSQMIQIRQWRARWAFAESAKDSAIPSASAWGDHLASTLAQQSFQPRLQNNHSMLQDAIGHMQSEIPFGFYDLLWVANPGGVRKGQGPPLDRCLSNRWYRSYCTCQIIPSKSKVLIVWLMTHMITHVASWYSCTSYLTHSHNHRPISEISFSDKCEFAFCSILGVQTEEGLQEQKGFGSLALPFARFNDWYFQDCVVFGRSGLYGSNPMKPVQISLGPPNAVHHPKWSAFPVPSGCHHGASLKVQRCSAGWLGIKSCTCRFSRSTQIVATCQVEGCTLPQSGNAKYVTSGHI